MVISICDILIKNGLNNYNKNSFRKMERIETRSDAQKVIDDLEERASSMFCLTEEDFSVAMYCIRAFPGLTLPIWLNNFMKV
jgi:hypothetical protein